MLLKDHFEKIVQDEQRNLEDERNNEIVAREKRRLCFRPIGTALEEAVEAFAHEDIGVDIYSDKAVFYYRRPCIDTGKKEIYMRWFVEPNNESSFVDRLERPGAHLEDLPGIKLIETTYFDGFPTHKRTDEYIFENGKQAIEFLVKKAAVAIARDRNG